jgi:ubiquinone/menaquinone biosynthesis C-methylase UbiE
MAQPAERSEAKPGQVVQVAQDVGLKLDVKPWEWLSSKAKDASRSWFIQRAEDRGIQWTESVQLMRSRQAELDRLFEEVRNLELRYPAYYTQPFHGYDDGNLSWLAAHELEAATQSIGLGYYQAETTWEEAQERFRGSARMAIADRWGQARGVAEAGAPPPPARLLDVGCSGGFSTRQMADTFPGVRATGLDLSPYYLAAAKSTYPELEFVHGLAEATGFESGLFDVVTFNFLLHELPREASIEALREAWRVLAPGGVMAVLDIDPMRLLEMPPFRRWAFQVTEPWCKDGEYYALDVVEELQKLGFVDVKATSNDPVNSLVLATKPAAS